MEKKKRRNRWEHVCRNGHVRTAENTHVHPSGHRQCKECPGWQLNRVSSGRRAELRAERSTGAIGGATYHRVLTADELSYLRRLIPCLGCGAPFGAPHDGRCPVPFNREAAA